MTVIQYSLTPYRLSITVGYIPKQQVSTEKENNTGERANKARSTQFIQSLVERMEMGPFGTKNSSDQAPHENIFVIKPQSAAAFPLKYSPAHELFKGNDQRRLDLRIVAYVRIPFVSGKTEVSFVKALEATGFSQLDMDRSSNHPGLLSYLENVSYNVLNIYATPQVSTERYLASLGLRSIASRFDRIEYQQDNAPT